MITKSLKFLRHSAQLLAIVVAGMVPPAQAQTADGKQVAEPQRAPPAIPTLFVTRTPNPMVAGQSYTVTWSTNGNSIDYDCTASGTGFSGSGSVPTSGSSSDVASAAWVGYPSSCMWIASNENGERVVYETLTTVAPAVAPTCSGVSSPVSTTTATSGGFRIYATGVANATSVVFPTWGDSGGQDDIVWYNGTNMGGGTWYVDVNLAAHKAGNPEYGTFYSHVYMANASFPSTFCGGIGWTRTAPLTPPALTLTCAAPVVGTQPTATTQACSVYNAGQTAASSIAYGGFGGVTVTGPSSCASGATCSGVTVTSPTTAGTYNGTITATPSPSGTAASLGVSLTVNTPPPPTLTVTRNPNPMVAGQSYTVNWSTNGTSISYSCTASGTGFAGSATVSAVGSTSGVADAAWVNYPSTCTWTATNGYTTTSLTDTMATKSAPLLSLSGCTNTTPTTPTRATTTCTLTNTGQTAAASIAYSSIANATVAGPTGACAAGSPCGTVIVTTGTAAGNYTGTLTATPNIGTAASVAINLTVNNVALTPPNLNLGGCTSTTPTTTPAQATTSCALSNSGQTATTSIAYSSIANATVSGPTGACAAGASCGTVVVTTGTAAGNYSGTLTATPTPAGTAASFSINLTVNAASPALSFGTCSSTTPTTSPTAATVTCPLVNSGSGVATSIAYPAIAGASISGPGSCAANSGCGNVVVTTNTTAATYSGTLSAVPTPAGTAASFGVSLTVNAAVAAEVVTYIHTDGLGSPVARTDASGVLVGTKTKYEPYGATVAGSQVPTIGFTGHVNDANTGLTYMQQRYYDPLAGRFMSEDPVLTDANTGAGFNRYAYANNNPYKYVDPDGRVGTLAIGVEAGIGATFVCGPACGIVVGGVVTVATSYGAAKLWNWMANSSAESNGNGDGAKPPDGPKEADREPGSDGKRGSTGGPGEGKRFPAESPDTKGAKEGVPCTYCGRPTTNEPGKDNSRERDHIDPRSKGGNNSSENERDSCRTCNRSKGARNPDQWKPPEKKE